MEGGRSQEQPGSSVVVTRPGRSAPPQRSPEGPQRTTPGAFRRFTLQMLQQSLREEELRAQHHIRQLRLRQKALEAMSAQLDWLERQRG